MPLRQSPIDALAENLAEWVDEISTQIADSLKAGLAAPGAAQLSQQQLLNYYARTLFNPDGTPNYAGRAREMQRLGPLGFAEAMKEVLAVFPDWKQPHDPWSSVVSYTPPGANQPAFGNPAAVVAPDQMPKGPVPPAVPGAY